MMIPELLNLYWGFLVFALGACVGSFLNVCVYRMPRDMSIARPPSHCPACNASIRWHDNVPIVGWIALRGRCRDCRARISPRYMLVEALTGALFLGAWLRDPAFGVVLDWILIAALIAATFIDFEFYIIPNEITYGGVVVGLALSALVPDRFHEASSFVSGGLLALLGIVVGGGSLLLIAWAGEKVFRKEAMGMGDVKLMALIGAFLGWRAIPFTLMTSAMFGSVVGISLMFLQRKGRSDPIPYGPYIALGALLWIFWGPAIVDWYLNLITPPAPFPT